MRVFVLEPTQYSMFKATKYGPLVFLFTNESEHALWHTVEFVDQIKRRLEELCFDSIKDVVAVSGKMISVAIFVTTIASVYDDVNLICFDHDDDVRDFREVVVSCCPVS